MIGSIIHILTGLERIANKFFSLFGPTFKADRVQDIKNNPDLELAIKSFLELGDERNKLVHQNFADCTIQKTAKEVYDLYQQAAKFIDFLDSQLSSL